MRFQGGFELRGVIGAGEAELERDVDRVALQSEGSDGLGLRKRLAKIGICIRAEPFTERRYVVEWGHFNHSIAAGPGRAVWHNSSN